MSDINWKDGAVCYVMGMQWFDYGNSQLVSEQRTLLPYDGVIDIKDFQLNEIKVGDYLLKSELDTEQKYNDVAEVSRLFGFDWVGGYEYSAFVSSQNRKETKYPQVYLAETISLGWKGKHQLTYHQIIAIGKLKRMMLEREKSKLIENASMMKQLRNSELDTPVKYALNYEVNPFSKYTKENSTKIDLEEKPKHLNKSKQAYDILKSLDYEYDLVKQKWFKKEYID